MFNHFCRKAEIVNIETGELIAGRPLPDDEIEKVKWQFEIVWRLRFMNADAMLAARESFVEGRK